MSRSQSTEAIVLRRVNHSEADRVITLLTKDFGRVTVYAKGVRKPKSKLAGGLELCMVSEVSFIASKKSDGLATITSSRMVEYFEEVVKNYDVLQEIFVLLKGIDKVSEYEEDTQKLFHLSIELMRGFNKRESSNSTVLLWFLIQLTSILGQGVQIQSPLNSKKFENDTMYQFDYENMGFVIDTSGTIMPADIKLLKLMSVSDSPEKLKNIVNINDSIERLKFIKEYLAQQIKQL